MLTVYLYNAAKPADCFDLSCEPMTSLAETAMGILAHHKTAVIWFGYLEGWMLDAAEETRLRAVIRAFQCYVITREPMSFSQAWKNEIDTVYMKDVNGSANTDNNGGAVHSERSFEHQPPSGVPPIDGVNYQD
jgi:hypothetical protein